MSDEDVLLSDIVDKVKIPLHRSACLSPFLLLRLAEISVIKVLENENNQWICEELFDKQIILH